MDINVEPLSFLPPIYAAINGITAVVLVAGVLAIKNGKRKLHERLMTTAIALSVAFLVMYVAYHMTSDSTKFGGEGIIRPIYFFHFNIAHPFVNCSNSTGFDYLCSSFGKQI